MGLLVALRPVSSRTVSTTPFAAGLIATGPVNTPLWKLLIVSRCHRERRAAGRCGHGERLGEIEHRLPVRGVGGDDDRERRPANCGLGIVAISK